MKRVAWCMFALLLVGGSFGDVVKISKDAYVRGGINADTNYGAVDQLWVRDSASADNRLKTYLEMDVGSVLGVGEQFSGVTVGLKSVLSQTSGTTFSLYGIVDNSDAWTETTVTWNNAPRNNTTSGSAMLAGASLLATLNVSAGAFISGVVYTFADDRITEYLNWTAGVVADPYGNGVSADTKATFVIVSSAAEQVFRFASAENISYGAPEPIVEYTAVIPEPATLGLVGLATAALFCTRRLAM